MPQRELTVSAIITAYNGEAFVADAIESVLSQTHPVDEFVVIDDGSRDNTAAIVERYHSRGVRLVRQQNAGLPRARNRGIQETRGDLIAFLDCDDLWMPEKTALQSAVFGRKPAVALVTSHIWWWDTQSNTREVRRLPHKRHRAANLRELAIRNSVANASVVMLRRSALNEVGYFDPTQVWAEDWELWLRIAARYEIELVDRPLMVYRTVPTSLTQQQRWPRIYGYYQLSRSAIRSGQPRRWRVILALKAWSWHQYNLAVCARIEGSSRWRHLRHAFLTLVSFPWDSMASKLKEFARALFGGSLYGQLPKARSSNPPRASEVVDSRAGRY